MRDLELKNVKYWRARVIELEKEVLQLGKSLQFRQSQRDAAMNHYLIAVKKNFVEMTLSLLDSPATTNEEIE